VWIAFKQTESFEGFRFQVSGFSQNFLTPETSHQDHCQSQTVMVTLFHWIEVDNQIMKFGIDTLLYQAEDVIVPYP